MVFAESEELETSLENFMPGLAQAVLDEFKKAVHFDQIKALTDQAKIARYSIKTEHSSIEGVGEKRMAVDPTVYHYWNHREPGCWDDKTFKKEFHRDNPEVRVNNRPRRETIVVDRKLKPNPGGIVPATTYTRI